MQGKRIVTLGLICLSALAVVSLTPRPATQASSHMDAPLITFDDPANTTDVYAFVSSRDGVKYLTTALAVYPFEEPGIGPNKYNFDDNVLYEIHCSIGDDLADGKTSISYQFRFATTYKNTSTILQSYLGVINDVDDANQNLTQSYTVVKVDKRKGAEAGAKKGEDLGLGAAAGEKSKLKIAGKVPPNNQGNATPFYNQGDNGESPSKDGVSTAAALDKYTTQTIAALKDGYRAFAGQRDDGFYADIQAIFDLLKLRNPGKDSQGGFNVHTIALEIPLTELGGDQQTVGVWASTSRQNVRFGPKGPPKAGGKFVQVARQGNPLFCEALVAIADKDLYSRTTPETDKELFNKYAESPELGTLLNALVFGGSGPAITTGRTDLVGIFIPDMIRVDLSTGPARLAGSGAGHATNPDDAGFSRLSIFGSDTLTSTIQQGFGNGAVPGGWPNGRRFGDDVVDIAVTAIISDLRASPPVINGPAGDNVNANDIGYNKVFPYAGTPLNGRNHSHP